MSHVIISSCQSAATSEIVKRCCLSLRKQRYSKYPDLYLYLCLTFLGTTVSDERRARENAAGAERQRRQRTMMTDEERRSQLAARAERRRRQRTTITEEARQAQLEQRRLQRSTRTDQQRQSQLAAAAERRRQQRAARSDQERWQSRQLGTVTLSGWLLGGKLCLSCIYVHSINRSTSGFPNAMVFCCCCC